MEFRPKSTFGFKTTKNSRSYRSFNDLEREKIQMQYKLDDYKNKTDRSFKETQAENDTKRTEIELMQLYDGNPYNDEVKNV